MLLWTEWFKNLERKRDSFSIIPVESPSPWGGVRGGVENAISVSNQNELHITINNKLHVSSSITLSIYPSLR